MRTLKHYPNRHLRIAGFSVLFLSLVFLIIGPHHLVSGAQQIYNKWMVLTMILDKIERFYVDETDPDDLLKNAIDGMLSGLDPHSVYIPSKTYKEYEKKFQGYVGVGLKYNILNDQYIVTSLVETGPAELAGLHVGDRIETLEGRPVSQLLPAEIDKLLTSEDQQSVELQIQRPSQDDLLTFQLPKRQISVASIPVACKLDASTGYIRIDHFMDSTPKELDQAFAKLQNAGIQQLLLDLRNNSGGAFDAGVAVADRFIPNGKMIVFTKGRIPHSSEEFIATQQVSLPFMPLVVLVDEATASDAEIVAGAIQDWDRGIIVGQRTFGKALVQTEYPFQDGSVLLLTTARYYTPLGRLIQSDYGQTTGQSEKVTFKTPKGRTVFGGGGIFPDFELDKPAGSLSPFLKTLYLAPQNPLYTFADAYITELPESDRPTDMNAFLQSFHVSEALLQRFATFIRDRGFQYTAQEFSANRDALQLAIKTHIAWRVWGETGRYTALALQDEQVKQAMGFFQQASKLASR